MRQYDRAIIIGRFQPFHNGHKYLVSKALEMAEEVVVIVGSANKSVSIKNPFTFEERKEMILGSLTAICDGKPFCKNRLFVRPASDMIEDEKWITQIQLINKSFEGRISDRVILVGYKKDDSSRYLDWFPQWKVIDMDWSDSLNATDMRTLMFDKKSINYLKGVVPGAVYSFIENKINTGGMDTLYEEYDYIHKYKKSWEVAPFKPTFITADAVVIQQGHILLVRRAAMPGKGLLALPGGFVNQEEYVKDACIRELREETGLKLSENTLLGSIKAEKIFDKPNRSLRGRTVTVAYLIHLTNVSNGLPKVKGGDDAASAEFIPLAELKEQEFFEDHFQIIQDMIGKL